jgi:hypothetical protein
MLWAATALADLVAVNGGATSVGSTRATLNGTVNVTDPDSAWAFQYSTSADYSRNTKNTPAVTVGTGIRAVSVTVTNLSPATTYHFRLVVVQGSYMPKGSISSDRTFTTLASGAGGGKSAKLTLRSHHLKVRHGVASIGLKCTGSAGAHCSGRLTLTAHGVRCGSHKFNLTAGHSKTVTAGIGARCAALLAAAPGHQLKATLRATFTSGQKAFKTGVTLVG